MTKKIFLALLFIFCSATINANAAYADSTVKLMNIMTTMSSLWNKGERRAFVDYYKHSDATIYVSSHLVKGYEDIEKEYAKNYPNNQAMGTLATSNLEIQFVTPELAIMTGNWKLAKKNAATKQGIFTLLWQQTEDGWKIILDH